MNSENNKQFDVVIYGASGFTGRYAIEELCQSPEIHTIKWAIAGRNMDKLKESLAVVQGYLGVGINIRNTPIIYADTKDVSSLRKMCGKARLILNCVGPYTENSGELIVATCIENGTHHIDISAELKYLENIQVKYLRLAQEKKVYVVEACGIGSTPSDYGISLLKQKFPGKLNSVEYYAELGEKEMKRTTHVSTLISVSQSIRDVFFPRKYDEQLKQIFKKKLPHSKYKIKSRWPLFYSKETNKWCVHHFIPDYRVLKRSQKFWYEYLNEEPVQHRGYFTTKSFAEAIFRGFYLVLALLLSFFYTGQKLLEKYPGVLTGGEFTKEGPTREQILDGYTKFTFFGNGWKNGQNQNSKPTSKIKLTISGPEAGYSFTARCMVQAGLIVLFEKDKLPFEGGVLTPGVAFANTTLQKRLEQRDVTFEFEL